MQPPSSIVPQRAPLRYYGGKWQLAPWVIEHFPDHECYVEPFGGGASVLLRKEPSPVEVYNDLDEIVVTFFRVLRERPEELLRALELTPFSRAEVKKALQDVRGQDNTDLATARELERARQFYVLSRQAQGGPSRQHSSGWRFARTQTRGNDTIEEWTKLDHLLVVAARLRRVQLECDQAVPVIKRFDTPRTLFYVDPPYVRSSRTHDRRGMYRHEMSDGDHKELAQVLHQAKGMVLVSGYPSTLYDELYGDWQLITCRGVNNAGKYTTECLWLSPSAVAGQRQLRMELPA